MSDNGNLALVHGAETLWSADTCCGSAHVVMQGDGNLVVYDGTDVLWASNAAESPGATLTVEDGGRAVIRLGSTVLRSTHSRRGHFLSSVATRRPGVQWSHDKNLGISLRVAVRLCRPQTSSTQCDQEGANE